MKRVDPKRRRPSRVWHRWLGFILLLPLLFLALTGVLLNHADQLGWHRKQVRSDWVLSRYGMVLEGEPISFLAGTNVISGWEGQLFWNGRDLGMPGELTGAVPVSSGIAVVSPGVIRVYDAEGMLIEALDEVSLPEGPMVKAGRNAAGQLVVQTAGAASWVFTDELLGFEAKQDSQTVWTASAATPEVVRRAMERSYRGEGVSWSRVVTDLHSGRFFGSIGVWLIDLVVVLLVVLSMTGLMLGIRAIRQGSNGQRPGAD